MQTLAARKTFLCLAGSTLFLAGWLAGQEAASTQQTVIHAAAWT
jgi:hypothetical protein